MRSAYVALALTLRVSKNLALALALISASAERNVRSVQVCYFLHCGKSFAPYFASASTKKLPKLVAIGTMLKSQERSSPADTKYMKCALCE
jgi:hypothetical protein